MSPVRFVSCPRIHEILFLTKCVILDEFYRNRPVSSFKILKSTIRWVLQQYGLAKAQILKNTGKIGTHKISMNEFPAIRSNSCPRNSPIRVKHHWSDDVISTGSLWAHHHSNSRHIWQKIRKVLWRLFGKIIIAAKTAENSAFLNFLLIHYRPESLSNSLWKFSLKLRGVFVFPDDTNDKSSGLIEIS